MLVKGAPGRLISPWRSRMHYRQLIPNHDIIELMASSSHHILLKCMGLFVKEWRYGYIACIQIWPHLLILQWPWMQLFPTVTLHQLHYIPYIPRIDSPYGMNTNILHNRSSFLAYSLATRDLVNIQGKFQKWIPVTTTLKSQAIISM